MTKNNKEVLEIKAAVRALKAEGISEPTEKQIREKRRELRIEKEKQDIQKLEKAPKEVDVIFDDGHIKCETSDAMKVRHIKKHARNINKILKKKNVRDVGFEDRWDIADELQEAAEYKVCSKVLVLTNLSRGFAEQVKKVRRGLCFKSNLRTVLDFAEKKNFTLRWTHFLEAIKADNPDDVVFWLKSAVVNRFTPPQLHKYMWDSAGFAEKGKTLGETIICRLEDQKLRKELLREAIDKYFAGHKDTDLSSEELAAQILRLNPEYFD